MRKRDEFSRSRKVFAFVILIGLSPCFVLCILVYSSLRPINEQLMKYDVGDRNGMSRAFTVALMENNEDVLRAVVAPEQWPEVDNWLDTHEAYDCKFSRGEAYINNIVGSGGLIHDGNQAKERFIIDCPLYRLEIDEIILEFRNQTAIWQIISWDVCERRERIHFYPAVCTASDFSDAPVSQ